MVRTLVSAAASAAVLMLSTAAFAQQGQLGSAQEARAMLDKAVAAVKSDQALALGMFNRGEGGFKDRDLYPFCFRIGDGKQLGSQAATPTGIDVRTLKDPLAICLAICLARNSTQRRRSQKVKSPRSATCFQSRARPRRQLQR